MPTTSFLVIGQREHAEALREEVATVLAPVGLRLSPEKTHVVHIDDGFDFLGFNIRRMRKRGSRKRVVYTRPSTKAIASIKDRVRTMTYRHTRHHDPGYLMGYLGRVLRGWANYFRYGVSKAIFNAIDSYVWERITSWLRKKHRIGWPELRRRFCLPGTWRLAYDGQRFRGAAGVTVTRYRYRGYRIPTPWNTIDHTGIAGPAATRGEPVAEPHGGFGGRSGETEQQQCRHRAPGRPNYQLLGHARDRSPPSPAGSAEKTPSTSGTAPARSSAGSSRCTASGTSTPSPIAPRSTGPVRSSGCLPSTTPMPRPSCW
jgi:hypothetical protein